MTQTFEDILQTVLEATESGQTMEEICKNQGVSQSGCADVEEACSLIENITKSEQKLAEAKKEGVGTAEWLAQQVHETLTQHGLNEEQCKEAEENMEKAQIEAVQSIINNQEPNDHE